MRAGLGKQKCEGGNTWEGNRISVGLKSLAVEAASSHREPRRIASLLSKALVVECPLLPSPVVLPKTPLCWMEENSVLQHLSVPHVVSRGTHDLPLLNLDFRGCGDNRQGVNDYWGLEGGKCYWRRQRQWERWANKRGQAFTFFLLLPLSSVPSADFSEQCVLVACKGCSSVQYQYVFWGWGTLLRPLFKASWESYTIRCM